MTDKFLALLGLAGFFTFMAVILWYVPETDLIIVSTVVLVVMLVDFCRELFAREPDK